VVFQDGCRLQRIGEAAFAWSELRSIVVPSSVRSVVFENNCRPESIRLDCDSALSCLRSTASMIMRLFVSL
jgi:hypothetical protein